jgi:hypothetical protein
MELFYLAGLFPTVNGAAEMLSLQPRFSNACANPLA